MALREEPQKHRIIHHTKATLPTRSVVLAGGDLEWSARLFFQQGDQFGDFFPLIAPRARIDRFLEAMARMDLEDLHARCPQGGFNGRELLENIDAIPIFFHHLCNAARLPFDTAHARDFLFELGVHARTHASFATRRQSMLCHC